MVDLNPQKKFIYKLFKILTNLYDENDQMEYQSSGVFFELSYTRKVKRIGNSIIKIIEEVLTNSEYLLDADGITELEENKKILIKKFRALLEQVSHIDLKKSFLIYKFFTTAYLFFDFHMLCYGFEISSIKYLIVLLELLANQTIPIDSDAKYINIINVLYLKILCNTNLTKSTCALIGLLTESCADDNMHKITDILLKCLTRNTKTIQGRTDELDYELLLLEIEKFLFEFPSGWWSQCPSDKPLRAMKSLIYNMAKVRGSRLLDDLNKISSTSELRCIIVNVLNILNQLNYLKERNNPDRNAKLKENLWRFIPRVVHLALNQVFQVILDKKMIKYGLTELQQFKERNPGIDINLFIRELIPRIQEHIDEGWFEIRNNNIDEDSDSENENFEINDENPSYYNAESKRYENPQLTEDQIKNNCKYSQT